MRHATEAYAPHGVTLDHLLLQRTSLMSAEEALDGKFQPRADLPVYQIAFPIDWAADPFTDDNWRFQFHAWRAASPSVVEFERTGDQQQWRYLLRTILDWRTYHAIDGKEDAFSWFDMSAAYRALSLAYVIDQRRNTPSLLTDAEFDAILELAGLHVAKLRDPDYLNPSNHGLFQLHGLMALCTALQGWTPCDEARGYAAEAMLAHLKSQFGADGVHLEQSPGYHFFALEIFRDIVGSGFYDEYGEIPRLLEKAEAAASWMLDARGAVPNVGDSEPRIMRDTPPPDASACNGKTSPCLIRRLFDEAGYAVIRTAPETPASEAASVFLTCSFHTYTHKQDDELSFEWVAFGQPVLTDTGKLNYADDVDGRFARSRAAHSSIAFHDFTSWLSERGPYGGCIEETAAEEAGVVSGAMEYAYANLNHRRRIALHPQGGLEVEDFLRGRGQSSFTVWWHFDPALEVAAATDGAYQTLVAGRTLTIAADNGACRGELVKGQPAPEMQGWVSRAYGQKTPRWSLGFHCPAEVRRLNTSFTFSASEGSP